MPNKQMPLRKKQKKAVVFQNVTAAYHVVINNRPSIFGQFCGRKFILEFNFKLVHTFVIFKLNLPLFI